MRRIGAVLIVLIALGVGSVAGLAAANVAPFRTGPGPMAGAAASASATTAATPAPTQTAVPTPRPTASPSPTPVPTPILVPAPLDGVMVAPAVAVRRPIAVMIDDLGPARPQSGFNSASVVWHAPAEGGIPRYMLMFQEKTPTLVGPVRSSRYYYIAWAAEWRSVYVHAGGSPQALATLRAKGHGQYVYNVDDFRYEGVYLWRLRSRSSPHNVYSDGPNLRRVAKVVGAKDPAQPPAPVWSFAPDAPFALRPVGGTIDVGYEANRIHYAYDRATNSYLRGVSGEPKQVDAATGKRVAPRNVVIMLVYFGPLNDGHPSKMRLEANLIGTGTAWISSNGRTIRGTWRKDAITKATRFFDAAGKPVTMTVGQTFIQVLPTGSKVTIKDGKVPPLPAPQRMRPA